MMSDESKTSKVNKYLLYNNIWTIEKIVSEFKNIHANRVSYV